jgi:uncharacterized low-complexity protein
MNPAAKLSSALLVAAVLTLACGADPAPTPTKVSAPPSEDGADAVAKDGAEGKAGGPRIAADEAVHDFGGIKATDTVEHVFEIRNTGDADLKIDRVQKT